MGKISRSTNRMPWEVTLCIYREFQSSVEAAAQNSCSTHAQRSSTRQQSVRGAQVPADAEGMQPRMRGCMNPSPLSESSILRSHSQSDNYSHVVAVARSLTRVTSAPAQNSKHCAMCDTTFVIVSVWLIRNWSSRSKWALALTGTTCEASQSVMLREWLAKNWLVLGLVDHWHPVRMGVSFGDSLKAGHIN